MMLTIEDIKKLDNTENVSTKVTVLDVSDIMLENNKKRFYAVIGDSTGTMSATVYQERDYDKFIKGFGVTLINVLAKKSFVGVTSKSDVAMCQPVNVPQEILTDAPKLPGKLANNIQSVLDSPEKTIVSVKGKVSMVSHPLKKNCNDKDMDFQDIVLKDKTGSVKVALWDNLVGTICKGQTVELKKCRVKVLNEEKKLSTTVNTSSETFTTDNELFDVSSDEEADDTFMAARSEMPCGIFEGVYLVDPYLSCPKNSCNNVKLTTEQGQDEIFRMKCKVCRGLYKASSCNKYIRAVLMLNTHTEVKKVSVFTPVIKKMFESRGLDGTIQFDKREMMTKLMQVIPMDVKYTLNNSTVRDIICKRINE